MDLEVYRLLGWTGERVDAFRAEGGSLETVAKWTEKTCPDEKTWKAMGNPMVRAAMSRVSDAEKLAPWAKKWRADNFIREAGRYEMAITTQRNPFYPMLAFNVPFEACMDLGVKVEDEVMAHALAFEAVRRGGGKASVKAVQADLARRGLPTDVPALQPFDMSGHPLEREDLDLISNAEAMKIAGPMWGGLAAIREKKCMVNDIQEQGEFYVRKRGVSHLAKFIHLNT